MVSSMAARIRKKYIIGARHKLQIPICEFIVLQMIQTYIFIISD